MGSRSRERRWWDRVAVGTAWMNRHVAQQVLAFVSWPLRQVLKLVAWLSLVLIGWTLARHFQSGEPDPKLIAGLAVLALVCALVAQLGSAVIPRIKKLGPFELFEEKAPGLLAALDDDKIGQLAALGNFELDTHTQAAQSTRVVLTAEQRFAYEQADFFISLMEFNSIDLSKDAGRRGRHYNEMLWSIAGTSFSLQDYSRALSRLDVCRRFKGQAETIDYSEGQVHYFWSLALNSDKEDEKKERERHLEQAFRCFSRTVHRRKNSYKAFSFLAVVCSALGDYGLANRYNGQVLAIRPQFALARYNRACNFVLLGRLNRAMFSLERIERQDEQIEKVLAGLRDDVDLSALRKDLVYRDELRRIYLRLGGDPQSWPP